MDDELMLTPEVAALTRYKPGTLRWMRHEGRGPRSFTMPGGRKVLYRRSDVLAWMESGEAVGAN